MNFILIDTSVWVEYFRGSKSVNSDVVDGLIDNNQICINNLILSELLPYLKIKKEFKLIDILLTIRNIPIVIDWDEIINYQVINIKNGINNVGIPDLIILQNIVNNNISLLTIDKHFYLMKKFITFNLFKIN